MGKKNTLLFIILAVQFVLIFSLDFSRKYEVKTKDLFDIKTNDIREIELKSKDSQKIKLTKKQGEWIQPDYFNTRVDDEKIENLLKFFSKPILSWPVSTTKIGAKNFEVGEDNYKAKIVLKGQDLTQVIFMGKSPVFKSTYFRAEDENETYLLPFSSYELSVKPEDWIDGGFLSVEKEKIESLEISCNKESQSTMPIALKKEGTEFVLVNVPVGYKLKENVVNKITAKIDVLYVDKLLSKKEAEENLKSNRPDSSIGSPDCLVKVTTEDSEKIKFSIIKSKKSALVHSSKWPNFYAKTSELNVKPILEADFNSLIDKVEAKEETTKQELSQEAQDTTDS